MLRDRSRRTEAHQSVGGVQAGEKVDEGGDAEVEEGQKVAIGGGMASMLSAVVDVLC